MLGVLDGGLDAPHFTGAVTADGRTVRQIVAVIVDEARRIRAGAPASPPARRDGDADRQLVRHRWLSRAIVTRRPGR